MQKLINNYSVRRKRLIDALPDNSLVIIPNHEIQIKSNDVEHKYKSNPDFYYLTGIEEHNTICLLKKEKRSFVYSLIIEGNSELKEIWVGKQLTIGRAKFFYKADDVYLIKDFESVLRNKFAGAEYVYFPFGVNKKLDVGIVEMISEFRKSVRAGIKVPKSISDPRDIIHRMRLVKDKYEISCMKKASQISKSAHILAMTSLNKGMYEYEIESLIESKFRSEGASGPAYPSIVGSGTNSTILHYIKNSKKIKKGDLVLIDAGCEYENYASDVTRTFPVDSKFSGVQKDLYEIVLESQLKAIHEVKPGKRFIDAYNKAVLILVNGLKELGLLKGNTEEIIKKKKYTKFFMHKLGHWLGLDVHDAGPYIDEKGNSIKLVSGMVVTVEPGIYISASLENIPAKFKGYGIRIEDDVLVTKTGNEVITSGIPKLVDEIEILRC
jgi:Xaa-Pro aminopeptidase